MLALAFCAFPVTCDVLGALGLHFMPDTGGRAWFPHLSRPLGPGHAEQASGWRLVLLVWGLSFLNDGASRLPPVDVARLDEIDRKLH